MSDELYQVTLTREQLAYLSRASETCSRLVMGQMDMALDWLRNREGKLVGSFELTKAVEALTRPAQGLAPNQSGGVGWHRSGDQMWDMHTHMRHRLAWDRAESEGIISPGDARKWPEMAGVQYDEPTNFCGASIKVERVTALQAGQNPAALAYNIDGQVVLHLVEGVEMSDGTAVYTEPQPLPTAPNGGA